MATLKGQTIVIIGGTSGIGYGVALACLQCQAALVIVASSSHDKVASAVRRLQKESDDLGLGLQGNIQGGTLDVKDTGAVKKYFAEIGEIDHLVFSSSELLLLGGGFKEVDLDKRKSVYDVRFWGAALAAQQAQIRKGGSIVFTGGASSLKPRRGMAVAASTNGALEVLTRSLAVELAPLRVNLISPGAVPTELWDVVPEEQRRKIIIGAEKQLLVGHVGTVAECAEAYLFVMKCGFITGEIINVNGGQALT